MKRTLWLLAQAVWISLCIFVLVEAYKGYRGTSDWQIEEGLGFEMIVLSFPASMLVVLALIVTGVGLEAIGHALPASSKPEMIASWLLFVLAGYVQWFIVVPAIPRAWKTWINEFYRDLSTTDHKPVIYNHPHRGCEFQNRDSAAAPRTMAG